MKFIITESKLESLIFKYLDNQDFYKKKYENGYVFWESKEYYESGGYITINVSHKNDVCFVDLDLVVEIATLFNLELQTSLNIIGEWVKTKIDFDFTYISSNYGSN